LDRGGPRSPAGAAEQGWFLARRGLGRSGHGHGLPDAANQSGETMKYAICNETFQDWPMGRACAFAAECGYQGIEIAPFTLAARASDVSPAQRQEIRRQAEAAGLEVVGLHWLLAKTEGFHLTSSDAEVRQRTADYLVDLTLLCGDLGGKVMVFGSPVQRNLAAGVTKAQ